MSATGVARTAPSEATTEASRRRSFAVISHPDAGKSTLTEALALHARVVARAGAVHGKDGRRGTVSDWMDIDFSEDTYRVLSAVDAAVMLVDAAKGLEAQTMKLFEVCRHRGSRSSP